MKKISFNLKYLITKYDWCFYFIPSLIVWKPYSGVYEINVAFLLWEFNIKYQLKKEEMKKEIFDFSEALRRMKEGKKMRRVIWEECGAYIYIVSDTIVAVCDGQFFPCVFKDSEDILATDWEEV